MPILFICFLAAINVIAFLLNGIDKWLAVNQKSRVSERLLLGFAVMGGSPGALFGMLLFNHKTSKFSFLWKFFGIMVLQMLLTYYLLTTFW